MQHDLTISTGRSVEVDAADRAVVEFFVPTHVGGRFADVAGVFSAWAPMPMAPLPSGGFELRLILERGREWRYLFLIDGERWMNDPHAADFAPSANGGAVSVLRT